MKRISSFLIVAALVAGMVGCVSSPTQYDLTILTQYNLTISGTEGGEITNLGEGTFTCDEGEVVSLVATPALGYQFVNWTGDVNTIENIEAASTTITMNGDYSIAANFEAILADQYSLIVSSTAGGSVTLPGEGTFACNTGTMANLVATPDAGHRFVNWTGDVDTIDNVEAASTTITMNEDRSITANFEQMPPGQFDLTTSSTTGGLVTLPGEGTFAYDPGTVVSLVATPATGYQFVNWTGDVDTMDNVEAASPTITMSGNCSITANFEPIAMVRYNLTITVTGGGWVISPGKGTFPYDAGTVVSLLATPGTGYEFVGWTGDVTTIADVNAASTTITMNGDYSITANFEAIPAGQYSLTTSSTPGGSVTTPGEGTFTHDAGMVVSLVATPATGYEFVNWTGDVGTIANTDAASTTITMGGDYSIAANFEAIPAGRYSLTTSSTAGGSVTTPGESTFTHDAGTVVSLVATPATGYEFVGWTGDVGTIANVNAASTTITMSGSYSIRADFLEDSPSPPGIDYTEAQAEGLIIVLVNAERQQVGLPALSEDPLLTSLAREHSISMVVNNFFSHDRYPGERPFSYGQLPGTIRGENIAMIPTRQYIPGPYLSLQEVCAWAVSLWMGSSGHRANILESRYTRTGVGVAFSEGGEYLYITQMFEGYY
ncbi:MAG: CAP domain-containing protein [Dehalococcoidia bacterium]